MSQRLDRADPLLSCRIERHHGGTRLALVGEVDLSVRAQLHTALAQAGAAGSVTVDMAGLTFLDCTGISVLLAADHELAQRNGSLKVVHPQGGVRRVLQVLDLLSYLAGPTDDTTS